LGKTHGHELWTTSDERMGGESRTDREIGGIGGEESQICGLASWSDRRHPGWGKVVRSSWGHNGSQLGAHRESVHHACIGHSVDTTGVSEARSRVTRYQRRKAAVGTKWGRQRPPRWTCDPPKRVGRHETIGPRERRTRPRSFCRESAMRSNARTCEAWVHERTSLGGTHGSRRIPRRVTVESRKAIARTNASRSETAHR
jgi:hypothetical protein